MLDLITNGKIKDVHPSICCSYRLFASILKGKDSLISKLKGMQTKYSNFDQTLNILFFRHHPLIKKKNILNKRIATNCRSH